MFGLGMAELLVVMVVALIVFGPKRLPEAARGLGKSLKAFKSALKETENEIGNVMDEDSFKK